MGDKSTHAAASSSLAGLIADSTIDLEASLAEQAARFHFRTAATTSDFYYPYLEPGVPADEDRVNRYSSLLNTLLYPYGVPLDTLPRELEVTETDDPTEEVLDKIVRADIDESLSRLFTRAKLSYKQQDTLRKRAGFDGKPMTQAEIGDLEGVIRQAIQQRETKALEKIRKLIGLS